MKGREVSGVGRWQPWASLIIWVPVPQICLCLCGQPTLPEIPTTLCPSRCSPGDVRSHCAVEHRAKPAAEAGSRAGAAGWSCWARVSCSLLQAWVPEPEQPGQGGDALLAWPGSHTLSFPMARPALLGKREGAGQPAAESENFPLPEPAAGCHLGRGSASFPNLPSLWKRGRKLCAEKIASPPS